MAKKINQTTETTKLRRNAKLLYGTSGLTITTSLVVMLGACFPNLAQAACDATVDCSGTNIDLNYPNGFGDGSLNGVTITVQPGALVQGTADGINIKSGSVSNSGTITGLSGNGIYANNNATVDNTGTIQGTFGLVAGNVLVNSNSGTITGSTIGIDGSTVRVTSNNGTISATGANGVAINSTSGYAIVDVTNTASAFSTGNITASGAGGIAIQAGSFAKVSNATGGITGTLVGIKAANVTVSANAGGIAATGTNGIAINATTGTADVTNNGSITALGSGGIAIKAGGLAKVSNASTIEGALDGISAANVTVTSNSGTIKGDNATNGVGILASNAANVSSSGTISGGNTGIFVGKLTNLQNLGTITGGIYGVHTTGNALITASGNISGGSVGILVDGIGDVTTTGRIAGSFAAIQFSGGNDILRLGTNSTDIKGKVILGAGNDSIVINARPINDFILFDSLKGVNITDPGSVLYYVAGNELCFTAACAIAGVQQQSANIGALAAAIEINHNDFVRGVSSIIPPLDEAGPAVPLGAVSLGFEAEDRKHNDAFANIPGLSAYGNDGMVFKSPTVVLPDGRAVWARGFGGERQQQADGLMPHLSSSFFGGAVGGDFVASPAGRIGAFVGAGETRGSLAQNTGSTDSDIVFGGLYGRYNFGAAFLHAAVQAAGTHNHTTRNFDPLLNDSDPAKGSFDGWYVAPEVTFGYRYALDGNYVLTPNVKVRYLADHFDSFTETGSTQNLTVESRTAQTVEERGELKLSHVTNFTPSSAVLSSVSAGIIGVQNVGSDTLSTTFAGLEIPFAILNKDSVAGGFGGANVELRHDNISVFAGGEAIGFSNSAIVLGGRGGMRVSF